MNTCTINYNTIVKWAVTSVLLLPFLTIGLSRSPNAADFTVGRIVISKVWSPATPRGARVGAGYLTIRNLGPKSERLVSGQSEIADRVEMHTMTMSNGIMRMRPLKNGVEIGPGETIVFKPGGHHFMFVGLMRPIVKGKGFKASLVFKNAGKVDLFFSAEGIGSRGPK